MIETLKKLEEQDGIYVRLVSYKINVKKRKKDYILIRLKTIKAFQNIIIIFKINSINYRLFCFYM